MSENFEWKTISVSVTLDKETLAQMNAPIPVREPFWRRILIRLGLAKQRFVHPLNDLLYGDGPLPKEFTGLRGMYGE